MLCEEQFKGHLMLIYLLFRQIGVDLQQESGVSHVSRILWSL